MKVFNSMDEINGLSVNALTWGSFDGVHRGHWKIITTMRKRGSNLLITFNPHPKRILEDGSFRCLSSIDEKIKLLKALRVDNLLILPFNLMLAQLGPEDFAGYILNHIKTKEIIVGKNHRFGQGRKGSPRTLEGICNQRKINLTTVSLTTIDGAKISSSRIRKNIRLGTVCIANRLLGRRYSIRGKVIEGLGRGRKIGRPTANLIVPDEKCIPMNGVYVGRTRLGKKKYDCLISLGPRPTFRDSQEEDAFEVHILDFDQDIFGRILEVYFVHFLRRHIPFGNTRQLKRAIDKDEKVARKAFKGRFIL